MLPFEVVLRKFGNSTGISFPASVLKDLKLKAGQALTMAKTEQGTITLTPKRKYTLPELIDLCDPSAPVPADLAAWDATPSLSREIS